MRTIPVPPLTEQQAQRFHSKVTRGTKDECWPFTGFLNGCGYGMFGVGKAVFVAHRVAWTIANGEIPKNTLVCHSCDNPCCCNPNHLFLGDQLANMTDMKAKHRSTAGQKSWNVILTDEQVREIRSIHCRKRGFGYRHLGKKYGVSRDTIRYIINGKTWKHLL